MSENNDNNGAKTVTLESIKKSLDNINRTGFSYYEDSDLEDTHKKMAECIAAASVLYDKYILETDKKDEFSKNDKADTKDLVKTVTKIRKIYEDISKEIEQYNKNLEKDLDPTSNIKKLLYHYSSLTYNYRSAFGELIYNAQPSLVYESVDIDELFEYPDEELLKKISGCDDSSRSISMIFLCKNVRIMEDLITKICNNNIDKSIVQGDRHIDSIRYGFEWLFCQNNGNSDIDNAFRHIDIRDRNRYLDFLKYQIMVSGRYLPNGPKTTAVIDNYSERINLAFNELPFSQDPSKLKTPNKQQQINAFKDGVRKLIGQFFDVYTILIKYRDLIFKEEDIRRWLQENKEKDSDKNNGSSDPDESKINDNSSIKDDPAKIDESLYLPDERIILLSLVSLRVLTDRFVSFVKINDLNFGNSTFDRSWFNYSELSDSNYAGSDFRHARLENAIIRKCDLSTCNFSVADMSGADFSGSNFNYSNLTAVDLKNAMLNGCQLRNSILRDMNMDTYGSALEDLFQKHMEYHPGASKVFGIWRDLDRGTFDIRETIIKALKSGYSCSDLQFSSSGSDSITIFDLGNDNLKNSIENIYTDTKNYLRSLLRKVIPSNVLSATNDILKSESPEDRTDRETSKGKVRFDPAVLTNISAKDVQMSEIDLSHIDMANASFENSDMSGSTLFYTKAESVSFIKVNFNGSSCFESDLAHSNFSELVANGVRFINCNLYNTNWKSAILINALFFDASAELQDCINGVEGNRKTFYLYLSKLYKPEPLNNPSLLADKRANVEISPTIHPGWQSDCSINDSKFESALIDGSFFINMRGDKSSFNNSSMKSVVLNNCSFHLSDFINVDLRYAFIMLTSLSDANCSRANITMAKIQYTDFYNANLSDTLFNAAELNHVIFYGANLTRANLTRATVKNCAFIKCNFDSMIIIEAQFENCLFENTDFKNIVGCDSVIMQDSIANQCDDTTKNTPFKEKEIEGLEWRSNRD